MSGTATTAAVLVLLAAFLVFALHLPSMLTAWSDPESLTEYASAPTPSWLVKLLDLGIIVPVASTTAFGLRRGASWARPALYPLLTGSTCLAPHRPVVGHRGRGCEPRAARSGHTRSAQVRTW